jgi:anti-sigma regulatory factor (Ser/Thr protein kinase)
MQQHLRWAFAGRGTVQHLFDDLVLCVSELVTTAVEAGSSEIALTLNSLADVIRLSMLDRSPDGAAAERIRRDGRGHRARIIDAVASNWGVDSTPKGEEIWVEFALDVAGSTR